MCVYIYIYKYINLHIYIYVYTCIDVCQYGRKNFVNQKEHREKRDSERERVHMKQRESECDDDIQRNRATEN